MRAKYVTSYDGKIGIFYNLVAIVSFFRRPWSCCPISSKTFKIVYLIMAEVLTYLFIYLLTYSMEQSPSW